MSTDFDPYLKWLGVRTAERPPNHYALLGISLFETDPEAIANAADRQMAHVRTYQAGKFSALTQQVLNELAAARVCLLNPARKAAYDASLQVESEARLAEAESPVPPPVEPPPVAGADWDFEAARRHRDSAAAWLPPDHGEAETMTAATVRDAMESVPHPLDLAQRPVVPSAAVALKLRRRRRSTLPVILFLLLLLVACLLVVASWLAAEGSAARGTSQLNRASPARDSQSSAVLVVDLLWNLRPAGTCHAS